MGIPSFPRPSKRVLLFTLALFALFAACAGSALPAKRAQDYTEQDGKDYAVSIGTRTAGMGIGLFVLYFLIEFCFCVHCCCSSSSKVKQYATEYSDSLARELSARDPDARGFYLGGIVILIIEISCIIAASVNFAQFTTSSVNVVNGVENLAYDFGGFLCTKTDSSVCEPFTVGDFLNDSLTETDLIMDDAIVFLNTLEQIPAEFDAAVNHTIVLQMLTGEMLTTLDWIDTNVTAINKQVQSLDSTIPIGAVANINLDIVDSATRVTLDQTQKYVDDTVDVCLKTQKDIDNYYTSTVTTVIDRIDGDKSTGSTDDRETVKKTIEDIRMQLVDIKDGALSAGRDIGDAKVTVEYYASLTQDTVSTVWAIPAIMFLLTTLCSFGCKSTRPLTCDMTFICLTQFFFCVLVGFIMLFAYANSDICEIHLEVIELTLGNQTVTIGDSTVAMAQSFRNILKCRGHQNFAGAIGVASEFNVSQYVSPVTADFRDVQAYLANQTDPLYSSLNDVDTAIDSYQQIFDDTFAQYDSIVKDSITEVDDLIQNLPGYDMNNNRDSSSQQDKIFTYYFFDWSTYQNALDNLNSELNKMNSKPPSNFTYPLDFDEAEFFTPTYLDTHPEWLTADYGTTTYNNVYSATSNLYDGATYNTKILNKDINKNNQLLVNVTTIRDRLVDIQICNGILELQTDDAVTVSHNITSDLRVVIQSIDDAIAGLSAQIDNVDGLVDFVATAPDYLGCKWIGDFYVNTIEEEWCTDAIGGLHQSYVGMIAITVMFVIVFGWSACYVNRKAEFAAMGGQTFVNTAAEGDIAMTPVATPSNLLDESQFVMAHPARQSGGEKFNWEKSEA